MGEIAPRMISTGRAVLLVGQAPGADGDVRPLTGTMGERLADLAALPQEPPRGWKNLPRDEHVGLYAARANVLDVYPGRRGKGHDFPLGHARIAAKAMWPQVVAYDRVLFCGKAVKQAFKDELCGPRDHAMRRSARREFDAAPMFAWFATTDERNHCGAFAWAWMPHTSLVNPWWNDERNVEAASRFLTDLFAWARGRQLRSV